MPTRSTAYAIAILYAIYAALFVTGCVTVKDNASADNINLAIWKSNAGEGNTVEQATDASAMIPTRAGRAAALAEILAPDPEPVEANSEGDKTEAETEAAD